LELGSRLIERDVDTNQDISLVQYDGKTPSTQEIRLYNVHVFPSILVNVGLEIFAGGQNLSTNHPPSISYFCSQKAEYRLNRD
jgi:hypothetical protein